MPITREALSPCLSCFARGVSSYFAGERNAFADGLWDVTRTPPSTRISSRDAK